MYTKTQPRNQPVCREWEVRASPHPQGPSRASRQRADIGRSGTLRGFPDQPPSRAPSWSYLRIATGPCSPPRPPWQGPTPWFSGPPPTLSRRRGSSTSSRFASPPHSMRIEQANKSQERKQKKNEELIKHSTGKSIWYDHLWIFFSLGKGIRLWN